MGKQYFLATTSLEEFWDPSTPMLFLGDWCLRFERQSYWKSLDGRLIDSYVYGMEEALKAYDNIDVIFEKILPIIATALNSFHNTEYSERYWRIVIGPWLSVYITGVYDRFQRISIVLDEYPNLTTTVLSNKSYLTPIDTEDFFNKIRDDLYNLQIYSKILLFLDKDFPSKTVQDVQSDSDRDVRGRSWKQALFSNISDLHRYLVVKLVSEPIVVNNSYMPKWVELKLAVKVFGKLFTTSGMKTGKVQFHYDTDVRKALSRVSLGSDVFCKCLSSMLFADMPVCFVEGYGSVVEIGKTSYPFSARAIFSANGWWFDEVFKIWAGARAENGTVLLGTPHGGDGSARLVSPSRKHEVSIVDRYYHWGFKGDETQLKCTPMPPIKLMTSRSMGADNLKNGIMLATTSLARYVSSEFPISAPEFYKEYLIWQARFVEALSLPVLSALSIRAHPAELGWCHVARLKEHMPMLKLDSFKTPFIESLSNCRLYVADHLSTSYAEALACNKPTILFWSPDDNPLMADAEQYFELLRNVGVLFDCPEAAADAVNYVYDDVEAWWNAAKRQDAVKLFREKFLGYSLRAENIWLEELKRVAL